ncbi:MAG TPA: PQQ-dependent sugar dehydrogenase, partial [Polyangiaceae bacterium]|nr:PQQ-dependent sugar dehydrogenase [Polyangiaceae bacterium]
MHRAHRPPCGLAHQLLGGCFALLLLASCTKKDQADREAALVGGATAAPVTAPAPAAEATPGAPSGSPGAGPTEAPRGTVAVAGTSARNGPSEAPKGPPTLAGLTLPPGFSVEVYSAEVPHARSLALGPKGVVFVSNRQEGDSVYALVDANGDHRVDAVKVVASGLDTPNGIAYRDGTLFIAEVGRLLRIDGIDGKLDAPPKPKLVTDQLPKETWHGWRYIRFGPDGWLYIPIGAPCNLCERDDPRFATIARMKADGTGLEVFARGVRNSVGFDWHPQTRELWFTDNGRDDLGDDQPGDELNRAAKGGLHFGFPYCHQGDVLDPSFGDGKSCASYERPARALGAHVAALGMRFYTGKMFPEKYRNAIIVAEHGSWNRARKSGYRVMVAQLDGNRVAAYEPLVDGWLNPQTDQVSGRPVDVEVLDDGSLLV